MIGTGYADTRDMYAVHAMFRREFALMPGLVRGTAAGNKERSQIVADHVALLSTALHHHHHGEDVSLWPRLLERVPKELDQIIHVMEGQHADIERRVSEVELALGAWRTSAASESREALAAAVDGMIPILFEHMGMEEEQILPIAEKHITAGEWDSLAQATAADLPREDLAILFGMVMYEGKPEVIEAILSKLPAQESQTLKALAPQAFATHSQSVYGTATPPRWSALRLFRSLNASKVS